VALAKRRGVNWHAPLLGIGRPEAVA
jgi:hypothetical protein